MQNTCQVFWNQNIQTDFFAKRILLLTTIEIHYSQTEREQSNLKMNQLTESVNHTITRLPTALPVVVIEAIPSDCKYLFTFHQITHKI